MKENGATTVEYLMVLVLSICTILVIALILGAVLSPLFDNSEEKLAASANSYIDNEYLIYSVCLEKEYDKDFCLKLIGK